MTLYAHCRGVGDDVDGWREGCDDCKRRTQQHDGEVTNMEPPAIIVFECEYRLADEYGVRIKEITDE